MSYDKLTISPVEELSLTGDKPIIQTGDHENLSATLTNIHGKGLLNKEVYFYIVDVPPEPTLEKPYISMNGELICDEYLPENNPMNPESSFGWLIYMLIGRGFDLMDEMTNNFLNDCDITSANPKSLDRFYGASLNLPRPKITENDTERLLTDKEYAAYLYLRNSRLMTRLDLMSAFGHCMGNDNFDDPYHGVTVTDEKLGQWQTVDHINYASPTNNPSSNISKNSNSDANHIVNQGSSEEVYTIPDERVYSGELVTFVNIPSNDWSPAFLSFLTDYISIKGNVLVREVVG